MCVVAGASLLAGASGIDEREIGGSPLFPLEPAWTADLGGPPAAGPAYDATHAYVPLRGGTLTAVSLMDGTLSWSVTQATQFTPTAGDGLVVVSEANTLIGLRSGDGLVLWRTDMGAVVSAPPLWTTGWLVATLETGEVVALRGADGHEFWRVALDGVLRVRPSISGTALFVPVEDGRIAAIELATGNLLWERGLGGAPREILPLDALFVGSTDNYFYRLSLESGSVDWRWRNGGDVVGAPTVDERRVYFVALDNILRSLDRRSGVQQWRQPLSARPTSGPVNAGSLILVSGVSPRVRVFDTGDGSAAGQYDAPSALAAAPYVVPGLPTAGPRMVILTGDGRLVGLQRGRGPAQFTLGFPPAPLLPVPDRLAPADVLPFTPLPPAGATSLATVGPPRPPAGATTLVAVDPPTAPAEPTAVAAGAPPLAEPATLRFTVQVVALENEASAAALADFLVQRGFDAYVVAPSPNTADQLHRVCVGRFPTRLEAEELAERIAREEALDTFIVRIP